MTAAPRTYGLRRRPAGPAGVSSSARSSTRTSNGTPTWRELVRPPSATIGNRLRSAGPSAKPRTARTPRRMCSLRERTVRRRRLDVAVSRARAASRAATSPRRRPVDASCSPTTSASEGPEALHGDPEALLETLVVPAQLREDSAVQEVEASTKRSVKDGVSGESGAIGARTRLATIPSAALRRDSARDRTLATELATGRRTPRRAGVRPRERESERGLRPDSPGGRTAPPVAIHALSPEPRPCSVVVAAGSRKTGSWRRRAMPGIRAPARPAGPAAGAAVARSLRARRSGRAPAPAPAGAAESAPRATPHPPDQQDHHERPLRGPRLHVCGPPLLASPHALGLSSSTNPMMVRPTYLHSAQQGLAEALGPVVQSVAPLPPRRPAFLPASLADLADALRGLGSALADFLGVRRPPDRARSGLCPRQPRQPRQARALRSPGSPDLSRQVRRMWVSYLPPRAPCLARRSHIARTQTPRRRPCKARVHHLMAPWTGQAPCHGAKGSRFGAGPTRPAGPGWSQPTENPAARAGPAPGGRQHGAIVDTKSRAAGTRVGHPGAARPARSHSRSGCSSRPPRPRSRGRPRTPTSPATRRPSSSASWTSRAAGSP